MVISQLGTTNHLDQPGQFPLWLLSCKLYISVVNRINVIAIRVWNKGQNESKFLWLSDPRMIVAY